MTGGEVAKLIDHTLLRPEATRQDIEILCREALEFQFANVCINPTWVTLAAQLLDGSGVGVCAVVGFPFGATTSEVKACEARRAMADGAREIDMVINIGALKSGDSKRPARHRRSDGCVPERKCDQQSHHRSGVADRRREGRGMQGRESCRRRFRQDVDRLRTRRRHDRGRQADAARRGARRWESKRLEGFAISRRSRRWLPQERRASARARG